jgi:hypothetical protein
LRTFLFLDDYPTNSVNSRVWSAIGTIAGGEVISNDSYSMN